jgi:hypothetical protein
MKLTKEQVLSFLKDDNTIADISDYEYMDSSMDIYADEGEFTLVVKVDNQTYMGKAKIWGSEHLGDWNLYNNFTEMILKPCSQVQIVKTEWKYDEKT